MKNEKTNLILPRIVIFSYSLLALALSAFIALSPIWGVWIAVSLMLGIWTKDNDRQFLIAILVLMIFGPIGRLLAPGTIFGSFWAFDFLVGFGLIMRINRYWPMRLNRDAINRVSTPLFFIIFSFIGLLGSLLVFPWLTVIKGALYTARWLIYYLIIKGIKGENDIKGIEEIKRILLIVASVLAILGFFQLLLLPTISQNLVREFAFDPHINRLFSSWFDPNYLGGFLVLALLLGLEGKRIDRIKGAKGILIGVIGGAVLLTFSRSSYLALSVGLLIYLIFKSPRLIGIIIVIALIIILFVSPVRQRVVGAISLDITARARLNSWNQAWQIIKVNPIVGVGYNLYGEARQSVSLRSKIYNMPYEPAAAGSDSSLLTIWATAGIGGLLVYLLLFWRIWRFGSSVEKSAIAALFVHSLFVNSLLLPPFMIVFWLIHRNSKFQAPNTKQLPIPKF